MKRIYKVMLASLIGLAFIIGTAILFGAAPTKTPTFEVEVSKVVDQTIYYNFKFSNIATPVKSYKIYFAYEYYPDNFIMLAGDVDNPITKTLDRTKTRLGGRGTFHSIDTTYTITSGDRVKVFIDLYDENSNYIDQAITIYQVP